MFFFGENKMSKQKMFRSMIAALFVLSASQFVTVDALATTQIYSQAVALRVIPAAPPATQCMACHTVWTTSGADKVNLKAGYRNAWLANTTTLATLKTLLNTLPTTTVGTANSGLAKSDVYEVYCANLNATTPPATLTAWVKDLAPAKLATVSIQIKKGAAASILRADAVDGDAGFSLPTALAGGAGPYTVTVTKSAYTGAVAAQLGPETYSGLLACKTATGLQTGTAWRLVTNQ